MLAKDKKNQSNFRKLLNSLCISLNNANKSNVFIRKVGTSQFKALEQPNVFKMFYCKLIGVFQERISPNNAKLNQPIIRKCI